MLSDFIIFHVEYIFIYICIHLSFGCCLCGVFFKKKFIYLFIYFCLRWVFVAVRGLSLVVASRATLRCCMLASHCGGFSSCGAWALGVRASAVVTRGL